ncbi:ATP-binding protein, partial [Streptomyces lunaelactis]|uniref:ATP-binding protein n=1 Tax=Streptomyces lunaelactis TaxID=1535768 RepID=UPI0020C77624
SEEHAEVTGEPAASKGCTAGSGRRPLEKGPRSGNLASGLPVLLHGIPPGRGFRLHLFLHADGILRVEIHDSGDGCVRLSPPHPEGEGGRGLVLVAALADKWGVGERCPGKRVWCEFALVVGCCSSSLPKVANRYAR